MTGIPAHFVVAPQSTTIAAAALIGTNLAGAVTIAYVGVPHVMLEFENTTSLQMDIVRVPITINGQGVTVAGTAVHYRPIPPASYRVIDMKSNNVVYGPCVYKAFCASTPSTGVLCMVATGAK